MAGIVPGIRSMGLRINSATVSVDAQARECAAWLSGAFSALVFLFDTETTELLAVLQDFYLNPIRVAATSAIVTKRLARDDAKVMGLFGSGTQALLQAECTCAVTGIEEIRVYGTRKERGEPGRGSSLNSSGFAAWRSIIRATPSPAATSSPPRRAPTRPSSTAQWLEPGTHVNTMIGSDYFLPRRETDDTTVFRSDLIVVFRASRCGSTSSRSFIRICAAGFGLERHL